MPSFSGIAVVVAAAMLAAALGGEAARAQSVSGAELLARTVAVYPTLASYADSGTVVREAPGLVDRWKFKTYYRRDSLDFYFDFVGVDSRSTMTMDTSYHRVVLWMIKGDLQSFNKQMRRHETVPRAGGNQPAALQGAVVPTAGTSTLIPGLIYAKANLNGTIRQLREVVDAGVETLDGRRCHKLIGTATEYYPSGARTNERQVTVWIDPDTQLIRKVFEDTPTGHLRGSFSRLTITIEPQANPSLDDSSFQFTVPK